MRRAKTGEEDQRPLLIDEDTMMSKDSTDPFYTVKEYVPYYTLNNTTNITVYPHCNVLQFTLPHSLYSLIFFPFPLLFYSNVNSQVEKIKVRHEKFLDLVKNTDTSSNGEFKELRAGKISCNQLLMYCLIGYFSFNSRL